MCVYLCGESGVKPVSSVAGSSQPNPGSAENFDFPGTQLRISKTAEPIYGNRYNTVSRRRLRIRKTSARLTERTSGHFGSCASCFCALLVFFFCCRATGDRWERLRSSSRQPPIQFRLCLVALKALWVSPRNLRRGFVCFSGLIYLLLAPALAEYDGSVQNTHTHTHTHTHRAQIFLSLHVHIVFFFRKCCNFSLLMFAGSIKTVS